MCVRYLFHDYKLLRELLHAHFAGILQVRAKKKKRERKSQLYDYTDISRALYVF